MGHQVTHDMRVFRNLTYNLGSIRLGPRVDWLISATRERTDGLIPESVVQADANLCIRVQCQLNHHPF
jgi:hypothetical protein